MACKLSSADKRVNHLRICVYYLLQRVQQVQQSDTAMLLVPAGKHQKTVCLVSITSL